MNGISEILNRLTRVPSGLAADIPSLLAVLGDAAEVDRVYVFENSREEKTGRTLHSQRYEWVRGNISVQLDNPELQNVPYDRLPGDPLNQLSRGECIMILRDETDGWFRAEMEREEIQSLLFAPIVLPEGLWGFVGFDDCKRARRWTEAEAEALKALGGALGSAIARQQTEQVMQALADNIAQFAWMADKNGGITWLNRRWYEFTGADPEEMAGWGWSIVHHPDHRERVIAKYIEHVHNGEPWEDTFPLRNKDGEYRWFLSRAIPIREDSGEVVRWFGTHTDVTELREHEEELNRLNAALRREIEERTALAEQLRELTAQLTVAEQRERRRIAEILHENFQQILAGCKFTLASVLSDIDKERTRKAIHGVQRQLDQAITISRSLAMELVPPELYQLGLAAALRALSPTYKANLGLTVHVEADDVADVARDEDRIFLYFAARELLLNVVKHAETDVAYLTLKRESEETISLTVRDEGKGCNVVGEPDRNMKIGFGVFQIRQRLEPLGGHLHMDCAIDKGCAVTITVPIDTDSATSRD